MARFVDLDDSDEDPSYDEAQAYRTKILAAARASAEAARSQISEKPESVHQEPDWQNCTTNASFAAALACYPVALSLSSHLDLNDLHSLSLTSRSIHRSLSQYSRQLIACSLRCVFDSHLRPSDPRKSFSLKSADSDLARRRNSIDDLHLAEHASLSTAHKISDCARDLVQGCRKCGIAVCRNCIVKAPSDRYLSERHRRLCLTCLETPLFEHLKPLTEDNLLHDSPPASSASSTRSDRSASGSSQAAAELEDSSTRQYIPSDFTAEAFVRQPCSCATRGVYLCFTCGHNLRAHDTTYKRVWTWRSRYSTHIGGGLGTGLGVGDQGQKCGRGEHCLSTSASSISWVEIDCSEGSSVDISDFEASATSRVNTPTGERGSPGQGSNKPGYLQQEIEGIGGVVKKKIKKRVKTGATVWEYDDERKTGKYLDRETTGRERSWCGWCDRVSLGKDDISSGSTMKAM